MGNVCKYKLFMSNQKEMVTLGPVLSVHHHFFFHVTCNKVKLALFFSPRKITHLQYLGDNIIFPLYILSNKEGLFYTKVIIFQFEYLVQIFSWRALLPVWTEMIRSFSHRVLIWKGNGLRPRQIVPAWRIMICGNVIEKCIFNESPTWEWNMFFKIPRSIYSHTRSEWGKEMPLLLIYIYLYNNFNMLDITTE